MKSFLSLLAVLAVWLLPIIVKAVKEVKNPPVKPSAKPNQEKHFEEQVFTTTKTETHLPNFGSKLPKEPEYFTYEREDVGNELFTKQYGKPIDDVVQSIDNEDEKDYSLTLEEQEVYKGIIYSEILKKKYN